MEGDRENFHISSNVVLSDSDNFNNNENPSNEEEEYLELDSEQEETYTNMVDDKLDWMSHKPLTLLIQLHCLHKHPGNLLTKYDCDMKMKVVKKMDDFYMKLRMIEVCFDIFTCRLFSFTLEGRASTWYHNLLMNSIHNLKELKQLLSKKINTQKLPPMLLKELKNNKMGIST